MVMVAGPDDAKALLAGCSNHRIKKTHPCLSVVAFEGGGLSVRAMQGIIELQQAEGAQKPTSPTRGGPSPLVSILLESVEAPPSHPSRQSTDRSINQRDARPTIHSKGGRAKSKELVKPLLVVAVQSPRLDTTKPWLPLPLRCGEESVGVGGLLPNECFLNFAPTGL